MSTQPERPNPPGFGVRRPRQPGLDPGSKESPPARRRLDPKSSPRQLPARSRPATSPTGPRVHTRTPTNRILGLRVQPRRRGQRQSGGESGRRSGPTTTERVPLTPPRVRSRLNPDPNGRNSPARRPTPPRASPWGTPTTRKSSGSGPPRRGAGGRPPHRQATQKPGEAPRPRPATAPPRTVPWPTPRALSTTAPAPSPSQRRASTASA